MDIGVNTAHLSAAYQRLSDTKCVDGRGSLYVFCAAKSGCGASYVARNMANIAAQTLQSGEQVLLVDMDIQQNSQSQYYFAPEQSARFGQPTGPYNATFGEKPFWKVTPTIVDEYGQSITDTHFVSLYGNRDATIFFNHFHWEHFKQGQSVHIQNSRAYWHKLREHFAVIIVDTPALDRADILSTICPEADANVLVCTQMDAQGQDIVNAANHLKAIGASCAGVILNQRPQGGIQPRGAA